MTEKHLVFINLGDSRCVLSRDHRMAFATKDHKPTQRIEEERIRQVRLVGGPA